jgi:hypothetical protein
MAQQPGISRSFKCDGDDLHPVNDEALITFDDAETTVAQ